MTSVIGLVAHFPHVLLKSKMLLRVLCLSLAISAHGTMSSIDNDTGEIGPTYGIKNPLIEQRADPWCFHHTDGNYYFTATAPEYDRIELRRARAISSLNEADPKVIWRKHDKEPMSYHIWAPEMHHIGVKWYVGPGHNSFTVALDGKTDLMFYHARNYKDIQGDPLRNPDRHTRVQRLNWRQDGTPDFGEPVPDGPLK